MTRYGIVVDVTKCTGCDTCLKACKDEYVGNDYLPYNKAQPETVYTYYQALPPDAGSGTESVTYLPGQKWMDITETTRGKFPFTHLEFVAKPCMHCKNAPCLKAATNGAIYRRADGIVIIDPVLSVGQTQLPAACPYGRIYWNSTTNIPQKCTMCAHLLDAGATNPKCVDSCPMNVFTFGDLDNSSSAVAQLVAAGAQPLNPEFGTSPNIFYIGLPKTFLSGTIENGSTADYLAGATVTLKDPSGKTWTKVTDNYGVFEFDGLDANQMFTLTVSKSGFYSKTEMVFLDTSKDIGHLQAVPSA